MFFDAPQCVRAHDEGRSRQVPIRLYNRAAVSPPVSDWALQASQHRFAFCSKVHAVGLMIH